MTNLPPSTVSICRRALLSAGWLIASRLAVSVKWRSWARGDEILKLFKRERGQPLPGFVHHRVRYGGPAQQPELIG
ncbi:hypothetical protein LNO88_18690 [Klebsiella pneumoniae subsp. pneumoniae]|nr:hypothetical protein [Klebsiella pneumoniae subsp. pneumoniae]